MKFGVIHRVILLAILPALIFGPAQFAVGGGRETDQESSSAAFDNEKAIQEAILSGRRVRVIVELSDEPLASYTGGVGNIGATRARKGRKFDRGSSNALGYARYLEERRGSFKAYVRSAAGSAVVEREFDTVFNGLAISVGGADLARIRSAPGVRSVTVARRFRPLMNISRGLIGAPAIDALLGGFPIAGAGIKIGVIDTGIDRDHPFFNPAGYVFPPGFPKFDNLTNLSACVSEKVIVARAYPANPTDPDLCVDTNDHGTHVAGTAAGNVGNTATLGPVSIPGQRGVANRAWLGNYNIFPNGQASADDPEIIQAIEDAVNDGMDVLNMSIGGGAGPVAQDPLVRAVERATEAGVVSAIAAGNSGPGLFTIDSPGTSPSALTAAASTNPHFVGIPATFGATTVGAALGQFNDYVPAVTAPLANYNNTAFDAGNIAATRACSAATVSHAGQIVVIDRGVCTFTTKVRNAQNAGAAAVLIVNNSAGDPVAMAQDGTTPVPTIDAAMVSLANRAVLRTAAASATSATVNGAAPAEFVTSTNLTSGGATANADIIAGFSSRGPTAFDFNMKPDFSGPGVNVLSSVVGGWAFFQGTSMATPHVAGAAALLRQMHPDWSPEQIKSALLTRAKRPVFSNVDGTGDAGTVARGGGRINLATANSTNATFEPANFSFGALTPQSSVRARRQFFFTNLTSAPVAFSVASIPACTFGGATVATFAASPSSGTVRPGRDQRIRVEATANSGAVSILCTGDVVVTVGSQTHRIPWLLIRFAPAP